MTVCANTGMIRGERPEKIVLSASRRTDLLACYPEYLMQRLAEYPPETVHTVVLWTKNPASALQPGPLRETLLSYRQLYVHLTVTGLGGTVLEPGIPPWETVAARVPDLVGLVKSPQRIVWRFDPLIRVQTPSGIITNEALFPEIAEKMSACGITACRTSWVEPYKKVIRRLGQNGCRLLPWTAEEKTGHARCLEAVAARLGIQLYYCAMEGYPRSRCIDGELLGRLHPDGTVCSTRKARGQRKHCGCTESIDIGWYSLKCSHGCLYCYAEPLVHGGSP